MNTEEMIKQAFEQQAAEAGDHRRVLAEVARRTSSRRRIGLWGITLITAGVAAVIATPVVLFSGVSGTPAVDEPAQPGVEAVPPGTPVLKYQPAWLPEKAIEQIRASDPTGRMERHWKVPGATGPKSDAMISLLLEKASGLPDRSDYSTGLSPVDINGVQGNLLDQAPGASESGGAVYVEWMAAPGERLTVRVDMLADAKEVTLRVAKSIRPDGNAAVVRNVSFGWLPAGSAEGLFQVSGTAPTEFEILAYAPGDYHATARITRNKPGSDVETGDGTPLTVRGKQGVFLGDGDKHGEVWVPLDEGRSLEVSGKMPKADLVKIAETMKIDSAVRYPWLGQH